MVASVESGKSSWENLAYYIAEMGVDIGRFEGDVYVFVGELYHRFRILEAVAYHYRDSDELAWKTALKMLVQQASEQRRVIEDQLTGNQTYEPKSGLERLGQFAVEEKCRWALRLLDESFPAWGY